MKSFVIGFLSLIFTTSAALASGDSVSNSMNGSIGSDGGTKPFVIRFKNDSSKNKQFGLRVKWFCVAHPLDVKFSILYTGLIRSVKSCGQSAMDLIADERNEIQIPRFELFNDLRRHQEYHLQVELMSVMPDGELRSIAQPGSGVTNVDVALIFPYDIVNLTVVDKPGYEFALQRSQIASELK